MCRDSRKTSREPTHKNQVAVAEKRPTSKVGRTPHTVGTDKLDYKRN